MDNLEERLQAVEDELAIRNLVARFTDAVNERDTPAFRALWTPDAIWEIGPPLPAKAIGPDQIVSLLEALLKPKIMFIQLTHSGVVELTSADQATGRFTERERGRGASDYYENLAVYEDTYQKSANGWHFAARFYRYRFLDDGEFKGRVFPIGSDVHGVDAASSRDTPATSRSTNFA